MAPPRRALPELMEELVEEVLLRIRIPPTEPAAFVRATLVCKRYRGFNGGPGNRNDGAPLQPQGRQRRVRRTLRSAPPGGS